jgi:hypothetical protein
MGVDLRIQDLIDEKNLGGSLPIGDEYFTVPKKKIRDVDEAEEHFEPFDVSQLGIIELDPKKYEYFKKQAKSVSFRDKGFDPLKVKAIAPNSRLDSNITELENKLEKIDLYDLLVELGIIKKSKNGDGNS